MDSLNSLSLESNRQIKINFAGGDEGSWDTIPLDTVKKSLRNQ